MIAFVLLILWPLAELFVFIEVARAIGFAASLGLIIVTWPIGLWAIRSQGRAAWRRLSAAAAEQRSPTREAIDGALILLGGILLMLPGFITDAIGVVLLLPPTRAAARAAVARNFRSRVVLRATRFGAGGAGARRQYDVDSTAVDVDQRRLRR